jgi:cAMP-dependent protein kinase regulator
LFRVGESGNEFFVVLSGEYEFLKSQGEGQPPVRVGTTTKGGAFGELALMYGAPRAATVRCIGAGPHITWATDRATFTRVLMSFFSSQRDRHEGFLSAVPLFQSTAFP